MHQQLYSATQVHAQLKNGIRNKRYRKRSTAADASVVEIWLSWYEALLPLLYYWSESGYAGSPTYSPTRQLQLLLELAPSQKYLCPPTLPAIELGTSPAGQTQPLSQRFLRHKLLAQVAGRTTNRSNVGENTSTMPDQL